MKAPGLALTLMLSSAVASAQSTQSPVPNGERIEIASCATGPGVTIGLGDARAVLADDERTALIDEVRVRYPKLADDGFTAAVFLLWQKSPRDLLYVSLQPQQSGDGTLCFTASFVAEQFQITPAVRKAHSL